MKLSSAIPALIALSLSASRAHAADTLAADGTLRNDQSLSSPNGRYKAVLQGSDGNFVIYDNTTKQPTWATNVGAGAGAYLIMQKDGNLVVYDSSKAPRWAAGTTETSPGKYFVRLGDDGLLTVQRGTPASSEGVLWSSQKGRRYKITKDVDIARAFRPILKMGNNTRCFPLAFSEGYNTKEQCNKSYNDKFALFATVTRPGSDQSNTDGNSFRVTYGVAFGYQNGTYTGATQDIISQFTDAGNHGEDAQYLVVDVVDGNVVGAWADLHSGYYARSAGGLTMDGNRVVAWVGSYYHPLKLINEHSSVCRSETEGSYGLSDNIGNEVLRAACVATCSASRRCGSTDTVLNWGDLDGEDFSGSGQLIMVGDACNAVNSYVSPDGLTYGRVAQSNYKLQGLWSYIGCNKDITDDATEWKPTFQSQAAYSNAYGLQGCKRGTAGAGSICHATHFPEGEPWATSRASGNAFIHPTLAGSTSVDYGSGSPFSDMSFIKGLPNRLSMRGGKRLDAVSLDNGSPAHGGSGGSEVVVSGLQSDPIVRVELCSVKYDKVKRVGHIKVKTYSGVVRETGGGYDSCQTIAPYGKALYGFYGRSGDGVDLLGTIWGDLPANLPPKSTSW